MSEPKKLPAFSSEASEAAWWFENSDKHDEEFFQRVRRGMEVASYLSLLMHEALERESQGA